eukprot:scaffold434017_cov19-Prasinocladus_malaysianus.AAC.1
MRSAHYGYAVRAYHGHKNALVPVRKQVGQAAKHPGPAGRVHRPRRPRLVCSLYKYSTRTTTMADGAVRRSAMKAVRVDGM